MLKLDRMSPLRQVNRTPHRVEGGGQPVLSFEQCFIFIFLFSFAFVDGGRGFEFCEFVAGWRHALRSEWPFIIIIINRTPQAVATYTHAYCVCLMLGGRGATNFLAFYVSKPAKNHNPRVPLWHAI